MAAARQRLHISKLHRSRGVHGCHRCLFIRLMSFLILLTILIAVILTVTMFTQLPTHNQQVSDLMTLRSHAAISLDGDEFEFPRLKNKITLESYRFWSSSSPYRRATFGDCKGLLEGDPESVRDAKLYMKNHPKKLTDDKLFYTFTRNCTEFLEKRRYFRRPLSEEENSFPIAYSILFFNNLQQTERLLRAIYHPQNIYCLHLDKKVSSVLYMAAQSLTQCFDNVILTEHREHIVYAGYSRLQADINCMNEVIARNHTWKYFINLAGSAFPLRTNLEIVNILKIYNGANDIEGNSKRVAKGRFNLRWLEIATSTGGKMTKLTSMNPPPPHGITIVRGSAYGTFSRDFVRFILEDERARDLLSWSRTTYSPDEHYWATLNHLKDNPFLQTPGGYPGLPDDKPWMSSYSAWGRRTVDPCFSTLTRHGVCMFGLNDLPMLLSRKELFANKFESKFEYLALECLEEYLHNRTITRQPFDTFYYRTLPFINRPLIWPPPKKKIPSKQ